MRRVGDTTWWRGGTRRVERGGGQFIFTGQI